MVLQVLGASNSDGGGENTCCPKCLFIGFREFRFRSDMFQYKYRDNFTTQYSQEAQVAYPYIAGGKGASWCPK